MKKTHDRTTDLRRLHHSFQNQDHDATFYAESRAHTVKDGSPDNIGSQNMSYMVESLAASMEASSKLITDHAVHRDKFRSNQYTDLHDGMQHYPDSLSERLAQHMIDLNAVKSSLENQKVAKWNQRQIHYEAIHLLLRSQLMVMNREMKQIIAKQSAMKQRESRKLVAIEPSFQTNEPVSLSSEDKGRYATIMLEPHAEANLLDTTVEVSEIEQTVTELAEMLQEISHLVYEQEYLVGHINDNISSSEVEIFMGSESIKGFFSTLQSRRKWTIRLIMTFLLFLLILNVSGML